MTFLVFFAAALTAGAQGPGPMPGRGPGRGFGPGGGGARFLGAEAGMPGRVVKNAPFSADIVTESTQTLPDGNHIRQTNTVKMYRDSEGRTRREQSPNLGGLSGGAAMPSLVFIHDPVAGVSLSLNATDKTGTRSTFTPGGRGRGAALYQQNGIQSARPRRNAANLKTESLGTQNIDGVMAEGRRTTMTIPAGQMGNELPLQIVTETWYSSELQTVVYEKRTDPRYGETVMRYTNVSRAEPSPTLFAAPSDFKVTEAARPRPRAAGPGQNQ
ncbi:MAG: hypothetical protein JST11_05860 [Acidobacteria bacterium]|nr:hypothetical protein [Acidobacteriota bacterium]